MKRTLVVASIVWLLGATALWAQESSIEGVVKDQSGALVPGAEVTVLNQETGISRTVISNQVGLYAVPLLKEGRYQVSCRLAGFSTQQADVRLQVGQAAHRLSLSRRDGCRDGAHTVPLPLCRGT